ATPPNVVLVLGCTVRKDQVSVYGAPENVTPFLAELAADGVAFDDTIAAAPWTRAASTSILTGFYAVSIGMVEPKEGRDDNKLPASVSTLAEHMRERGYYTLGATANPNLSPTFGFDQGFDSYQEGLKSGWTKMDGESIVETMLTTLSNARAHGETRPVYLRVMLIDAHSPRDASPSRFEPYGEPDVPDRVAQYRYHLHKVDEALATLEQGLRSMGLDETNTIFMFIADHGEGMNYPRQHGYSHGQYLTPSTNHIAWVMRGPGVAHGHRVRGVSSQTDVVPTILGLIGRPLADPGSVEGRDWSALVRGEGSVTGYESVWSDTWFREANRAAIFTHGRQCQLDFGSSNRQSTRGLFTPGCYDRDQDPLYRNPSEDEALLARLTAWREERTAHLGTLTIERADVDEGLSKELEVLGYRE
ncbi:MAG TPA: sulfatase, partial [Myxococcota bacterium]|nr:sulfatase [Myxococcota bacterium]